MAPAWPLAGRLAERDLIERLVRSGRSALVVGPAGIGKTRLATEIAGANVVDLEWGDALDRRDPCLFTMREDRIPPEELGDVTRIDLPPLAADDVDQLIDTALRTAVATDLRRWLHTTCAGNPGLLAELLTDGIERGAISVQDGRWSRDPAPTLLTPRLLAVLAEHRSTLSADEWAGRELVAVSGRLGRDHLVELIGAAAVDALVVRGLLTIDDDLVRIPNDAQRSTVLARIGPMGEHEIRRRLGDVAVSDWQTRSFWFAFGVGVRGDLAAAAEQTASGLRIARREGDREGVGCFGASMSTARLARGEATSAVLNADEAVRSMLDADRFGCLSLALSNRVIAYGYLGRPADAAAALADLEGLRLPPPPFSCEPARARAWALVAAGDVDRARGALLAGPEIGVETPTEEAVRLQDVVRLGGAADVVDRLRALRGVAAGVQSDVAIDQAVALVEADADALERAAERFVAMGACLLAAEAWGQASTLHSAQGRVASAARAAVRCRELGAVCEGAETPAMQIDDALAVLSRRERQIVRLAANGRTNREIADELVLSVRTVESHLAHVYTKLGISGRTELTRLL